MTLHLAINSAVKVMTAQVNQIAFTYPIAEVTMDNVSTESDPGGDHQFVREEMVVLFGTAAFDDSYGRQRIRKVPTSTTLYFGRSSQGARDGEVDLVDDAWITVLSEYRVWPKIPYIDTGTNPPTIYKDHDLTKPTNWPPVANAGAYTAGVANTPGGHYEVTLPEAAGLSFAVADGATISTYTWELPDGNTPGTPVTLVSTENPVGATIYDTNKVDAERITVESTGGTKWYVLNVTDSNGETHRAVVAVYCYDPNHTKSSQDYILDFEITNHVHRQNGQEISIIIRETLDKDTWPDGALVFLWEDEPADSEDRSHMLFFGYHQGDPATIASERRGVVKNVVFNCVDVAGRMRVMPGFPFTVGGDSGNFSDWAYMANPNWFKFMHYCLWWHSSALTVADWSPNKTVLDDYPFVVRNTAKGNIFDQIASQAQAVVPDFILTCNYNGQLLTRYDPMIQIPANRHSNVQANITEADWSEITYENTFWPRYHWLREEAVRAHATTIEPYFSISPGDSPGMGEGEQPHGEQLALSQSDLNDACGQRYGRLNAPQSPFTIVIPDPGYTRIDPAEMTWVTVTVGADYAAQRGLTFTSDRGLPLEVQYSHQYSREGYARSATLIWERETEGIPGQTYNYPGL